MTRNSTPEFAARIRMQLFQLIVVLVLGAIVILFMAKIVSAMSQELSTARDLIYKEEHRVDFLNELKEGYGKVEKDLPALLRFIPPESELPESITRLDVLSDSFGRSVNIKIGEKELDERGAFIPLTISMDTNLPSVSAYLRALEALPFLVVVAEVRFEGSLESVGTVTITAHVFVR